MNIEQITLNEIDMESWYWFEYYFIDYIHITVVTSENNVLMILEFSIFKNHLVHSIWFVYDELIIKWIHMRLLFDILPSIS